MAGAAVEPRRPWRDRRVLLGVTGGIAAYKTVQTARDLALLGASVDVILTHSAQQFVGALSFEGVTGRPVVSDILAPGPALDHIRLAREADVVCVAPATADFMARAAAGRSDDLLCAVVLATRAPVLLCPAMNDRMWSHPQTQANARHLSETLGYRMVGPAQGPLAFGEGEGPGRMEDPATIIQHIGRALGGDSLAGRRIVVTAGPTQEPIDPVRILTNRSSGRMGFALASAAWRRGADVTVVSGPASAPAPAGPRIRSVRSADEMGRAVKEEVADADALLMSAAVADFRPAGPATRKIKKASGPPTLELEPAPDILREVARERGGKLVLVGFALETDSHREHARRKLEDKGLDLIVLNDALEPDAGFEVDTNRVVILGRDGSEEELPVMLKDDVAEAILDRLETLLSTRV
jgi:phosphopantothenoylcysteine decarboxylase / phosphopantothenate---cysteine ligase